MKVKISHIKQGIEAFYATEIAPMNWKLYFTLPLVRLYLNNFEQQNSHFIKGLVDQNGEIDIDELHKEYAQLISSSGGMVNIGPIQKVTIQDLDKLVASIKSTIPPTTV